ncbi:MAG: flagellar biosynthesis protein FlhB [Alphaproteobacteria bacterium]
MADDEGGEKTEEPTDKRMGQAREEGNIPISQELIHFVMMTGILVMVWFMLPRLMAKIVPILRPFLAEPHAIPTDFANLERVFIDVTIDVMLLLAFPIAMFMLLGVAANVAQNGFSWSSKKLAPNLGKLSPINGLKRMFGSHGLTEFVKGIIKLVVITWVMYAYVGPRIGIIAEMPTMDMMAMMVEMHDLIIRVLMAVLGAMVIIAGADLFYQRFKHYSQLKMTKTEVKDESKASEGDPQVKGRIRRMRAEKARMRMMQAVPNASVVVTNPTHYAVALVYEMEEMSAPRLVAKGVDSLALRIREVAEENEVPIVENPPLARALYATVELDHEIPPDHYKAVAEVIGYVMRLKGKLPR